MRPLLELFLEFRKSLDELVGVATRQNRTGTDGFDARPERLELAEKLLTGLPVPGLQPFHDVDGTASEPIVHTDCRKRRDLRRSSAASFVCSCGSAGLQPKTRLPVPARALVFADIESIDVGKEGMTPGAKVLIGLEQAPITGWRSSQCHSAAVRRFIKSGRWAVGSCPVVGRCARLK